MRIGLPKCHMRGHWATTCHRHNIPKLVSVDASKPGHDQWVRCASRDQAYETQACKGQLRFYQLSINIPPRNSLDGLKSFLFQPPKNWKTNAQVQCPFKNSAPANTWTKFYPPRILGESIPNKCGSTIYTPPTPQQIHCWEDRPRTCKWLITMVSKSPKPGSRSPSKWPISMA